MLHKGQGARWGRREGLEIGKGGIGRIGGFYGASTKGAVEIKVLPIDRSTNEMPTIARLSARSSEDQADIFADTRRTKGFPVIHDGINRVSAWPSVCVKGLLQVSMGGARNVWHGSFLKKC
jgi:hypothetical protein